MVKGKNSFYVFGSIRHWSNSCSNSYAKVCIDSNGNSRYCINYTLDYLEMCTKSKEKPMYSPESNTRYYI